MDNLEHMLNDLIDANHILAHEGVVDAFGHASIRDPRNPEHFIMSRARAPELVEREDLITFDRLGEPVISDGRSVYAERFIHAGIYEARSEVNAVIHNHAYTVVPFSVSDVPLRPIAHVAGVIGNEAPVWDISEKFGDTDMLVVNMEQARDLAQTLAGNPVVLMRGHGCVVVGETIKQAVMTAIYLLVNAQLLLDALRLGSPKYLSPGEVKLTSAKQLGPIGIERTWEYWVKRARG